MNAGSEAEKKVQSQIPDSLSLGLEEATETKAAETENVRTERAGIRPQKFSGFVGGRCKHEWYEVESDLQTLSSEGKTIWRCRVCAEITNTYSWRKP
jgi:hypothetical protein